MIDSARNLSVHSDSIAGGIQDDAGSAVDTTNDHPALDKALDALHLLGMTYRKLMMQPAENEGRHQSHPCNLSPLTLTVLYQLKHAGMMSPSQLSDNLSIARPNLTPILTELKRLGLIYASHDLNDKRVQLFFLTEKGITTVEELKIIHKNRFRTFLSKLTPGELEEMGSSAERLGSILGKYQS